MASLLDRMREAGLPVAEGGPPAPPADYARLASELVHLGVHTLGLVPAGDDVGVPGVALGLAAALRLVGGGVVGVVDAQGSWPAPAASGDQPAPALQPVELAPQLVLFTGRPVPGTAVQRIRDALGYGGGVAGRVVLDLTGLDRSGEHLEAMSLVDRVVVVARAGRSTPGQLRRRLAEIPSGRSLGVLLVGAGR